jgi:hypothetical protein
LPPCEPPCLAKQAEDPGESTLVPVVALPSVEAQQAPPAPYTETIVSREVVRLVETVTETVKVTATEPQVVTTDATAVLEAPSYKPEDGESGHLAVEEPLVDEPATTREDL